MILTEKEVELLIFEDLRTNYGLGLKGRGLELNSQELCGPFEKNKIRWFRQLSIPPYGIIDLVGFFRHNGAIHVELIELKSIAIESEHFEQLFKYRDGLDIYLHNTFKNPKVVFSSYLIGRGFNTGTNIQNNTGVIVSTYDYDLSGIQFKTFNCDVKKWRIEGDEDSEKCSFRFLLAKRQYF